MAIKYELSYLCALVQFTVLSAGFSIFVSWKFAVHGVHNLRPCTGFLFPVNSCKYCITVCIPYLFLPNCSNVLMISQKGLDFPPLTELNLDAVRSSQWRTAAT